MWQSLQTSVNGAHGTTGVSDVYRPLLWSIYIYNFYSCQGSISLPFLNSEALQNIQECWKKKSDGSNSGWSQTFGDGCNCELQ